MAGGGRHPGPIGSKNNRNRVRISRASTGGAGFNSPRRALHLIEGQLSSLTGV